MNDRHGIGHNQPPEPTAIERARLLVTTANLWAVERGKISDEEMAGLAQEFVTQLRRSRDQLDDEMKREREPHDLAVAEIRKRYRDPQSLIGIALIKMGELLAPWLKAKQDRLDAEAAERQRLADEAQRRVERASDAIVQSGTIEAELELQRAAEEADNLAKAAAKPPERAQIKGDLSQRASSLVTTWHAEIVDEGKALKHFGKAAEVRKAALDAIRKLAGRMAREMRDASKAPPGIKFVPKETPR